MSRARAPFVVALASLVTLAPAGCASLLGGLDEGTSMVDAAAPSTPEASSPSTHDARCATWLDGFRHRSALAVKHEGAAIPGYQVKLAVATPSLIAAGKMRADLADLRITSSDGVTVLPHWIQSGTGAITTVWTRLDLGEGTTSAWLYYGSDTAVDVSSPRRTFAPGIVDDPGFERDDAWFRAHEDMSDAPASRTNEWSATLGGGKATVRLVRGSDDDAAFAGICQTVLFPGGSSYRIALDLNITLADHAQTRFAFGGLGGPVAWATPTDQIGFLPAMETGPIDPGTTTVCLTVAVESSTVGQGVEATFSGLRVRRSVRPEPTAEVAVLEESACR